MVITQRVVITYFIVITHEQGYIKGGIKGDRMNGGVNEEWANEDLCVYTVEREKLFYFFLYKYYYNHRGFYLAMPLQCAMPLQGAWDI